jgi:hypothetical protein
MSCCSKEQRDWAEKRLSELLAEDDMILVKKSLSTGAILYSALPKDRLLKGM